MQFQNIWFLLVILMTGMKSFCKYSYFKSNCLKRTLFAVKNKGERFDKSGLNSESASSTAGLTDPWKILIKKLDSSKESSGFVGKIQRKESKIVDELQCPHFGVCSGCTITGKFTDSAIVRRAKSFFQLEDIILKVHLHNITQWRTNVKLAVQPTSRWGGLKIGLYRTKSHIVEPIPDCRVHHPSINIAVEELRQLALDTGVVGYQEARDNNPATGELRYIQMSVERLTSKIQLVLVWNALNFKSASPSLSRLVKRLKSRPDLWHSITVNFQTSEGNTILNYNPKAWKLLWGPQVLKEKIGNATFFFRPQIFRQVLIYMCILLLVNINFE
jgi:tRNA/tmRNA/rRNA uracil-C5-methylase (TrmA/RlmC/RlmD family)